MDSREKKRNGVSSLAISRDDDDDDDDADDDNDDDDVGGPVEGTACCTAESID